MESKQLLKKAGFSEKEIEVYLALLAHGDAVASDIAEQAGINRSTTYVILDALTKRGLVETVSRSGVAMFTAGPAENLVKYFERASGHFNELAGQARKLLPSLKKAAKANADQGADSAYGAALSSLGKIRGDMPRSAERHSSAKPLPKAI